MSGQYEAPKSVMKEQAGLLASQLAQLVEQGKQPLTKMLDVLVEERQTFAESLMKVQTDVLAGEPLSRACLKESEVFGRSFAEAVREGEVQGDLSKALKRFVESQAPMG